MCEALAYFIGVALGDGNLSNPNGRAVRLRVTCDNKYPLLIKAIAENFEKILPENKVGLVLRRGCTDISVFSNRLPSLLGWQWDKGPKHKQNVGVPDWITNDVNFVRACLRGLFQTDGCAYKDRGYTMVNFTNVCVRLAEDVYKMTESLGYRPNMQILRRTNLKPRYTLRIAKSAERFIEEIGYWKK